MNNRETATVIWLGIALAACLCGRDIRGALLQVVKSFTHPKVLGPVMALAAWTVGLVALAHTVGVWESDVRNDTVTWFITVGIVFYFSLGQVKDDGFFRTTARRAVTVTIFVEGFVNLAVFALPIELVLLPVVTFLVMLAAFSEGKEEYARAHRLVNGVLSVLGISFILYAAERVVADFDAAHTVRVLVLPVWLTLGTIPFIYAVGLWSAYEEAFSRVDIRTDAPANRRRAKRALVRAANMHAADVGGFVGHWIWDLASAESDDAARAVMRRWRKTWRTERQAEHVDDARQYMNEWLTQADPAVSDLRPTRTRCGEAGSGSTAVSAVAREGEKLLRRPIHVV